MIPSLHIASETNFDTLGLGGLADAISCTVTEERNGEYELEMEYPVNGIHFNDLAVDRIIVAPNNDKDHGQPFRIYFIRPAISGRVTVLANHISYQLSYIPCKAFSATGLQAALDGLVSNAVKVPMPFTLEADFSSSATYTQVLPQSIRACLGGADGSILDVFGGEFEFDRYAVRLHKSRGYDNHVVIAYGKNLMNYEQETNISNLLTGIYPYYCKDDSLLVLPEGIVTVTHSCSYPRIKVVDLSDQFEELPTISQLRTAAQSYINNNQLTVPRVSIKASFCPLWQTEEFKDIAPLEHVRLCDTVIVQYPTLGVEAKAKVIKVVYNVLEGRYDSIELGDARQTLDVMIASLLKGGRK